MKEESILIVDEMVSVPKSQLESIIKYNLDLEAEVKRLKTQQFALLSVLISIKDKLGINEMVTVSTPMEAVQYANKYWFKDTLTVLKSVLKSFMPGSSPFNIKEYLRIDFNLFSKEMENVMPIIKEWDAEYTAHINEIKDLSQPNILENGTPE